jgi:hypothetical protein
MNALEKTDLFDALGRCNLLCEQLKCWGVLNRFPLTIGQHVKEVFFFTYKPHKENPEFVGHITWGEDGIFFRASIDSRKNEAEPVIAPSPHENPIANDDEYATAVARCFIELARRLVQKKSRQESKKKGGGRRNYAPPELNALNWGKTITTHSANVLAYKGKAFDNVFADALLNLTDQGIVCKGKSAKKKGTKKAKSKSKKS